MMSQHDAEPVGASDAADDAADRRRFRRVSVDLFVEEHDGDRFFVHPAVNLSSGGVFILSHSFSLRKTTERGAVDLEIPLPTREEPLRVKGRVVWSRRMRDFSHGLGVRFEALSEHDQEALEAYLDLREAEGAEVGPPDEAAPLGDEDDDLSGPSPLRRERRPAAAGSPLCRPSDASRP